MFAKGCPQQSVLQCYEYHTFEFLQKVKLRDTCKNTHNDILLLSFATKYCVEMLYTESLTILAQRKFFLKMLTD